MKKILLTLMITLFSFPLFAADEKPGRFFEDQPDITERPLKIREVVHGYS